ncbi:hypothetical protein Plhal304r1_c013g0049921 [Plasmopara halstedii]
MASCCPSQTLLCNAARKETSCLGTHPRNDFISCADICGIIFWYTGNIEVYSSHFHISAMFSQRFAIELLKYIATLTSK